MFACRYPVAALCTTTSLWAGNANPGVTGSSRLTVKLELVAADLEMSAHDDANATSERPPPRRTVVLTRNSSTVAQERTGKRGGSPTPPDC